MNGQKHALEKNIFSRTAVICSWVVITACSGNTQYHLFIDVRSFIEEDKLTGVTTLSTDSSLIAYLLPLFEFLEDTAIPDRTIKHGLAVQLPLPSAPDEVRLRFEARLVLELMNLSGSAQLPGSTVSLYLAPADADDLYAEGSQVFSIITPPVLPDSRATIDFHPVIRQGDPGYEYLRAGSFLAGIKVTIPAADGVAVDFAYDLRELAISISGYPFGLIP